MAFHLLCDIVRASSQEIVYETSDHNNKEPRTLSGFAFLGQVNGLG